MWKWAAVKKKKASRNTYDIASIKRVSRTFHVAVVQNNSKEMYKKVCCTGKVFFLLIRSIDFFCRSCRRRRRRRRRRLALHDFIFGLSKV